jgi:pimeloyl-ACP methyl ester carboxylesterase
VISAVLVAALALACGDNGGTDSAAALCSPPDVSPTDDLPNAVEYRQSPEGVRLPDPEFEPLPGACADFGLLGGAAYQIEIPDDWNGRLVLDMHGYEELALEAGVSAPDIRRYLVGHGYAWGASSFSSTMHIPGRSADETAALWDYFASTYGRPERTYVTGESMGGQASHIAAERYGDRFDGALARCGSAGEADGFSIQADFFAAAAYLAGLTQADFDNRNDLGVLIRERIMPALEDPGTHEQFENIMLDLTGGSRTFDREGFRAEEETNWRRAEQLVTIGAAPNDHAYELGPLSDIPSEDFNDGVIRLPVNAGILRNLTDGNEITGDLQMPLLTMHTTGDWQVPISHALTLRRAVDAMGRGDLLVQRVYRDPGHCGFSTAEIEQAFEALVAWVEDGVTPDGEDVLVGDLRTLGGTFELTPRPGTPEADAVSGAADRAVIGGELTLDGEPFDARWLGAVVVRDGLVTPCQYTLPPVEDGRYEITVLADSEASGCGAGGTEVLFWTFVNGVRLWSVEPLPWPGPGAATYDGAFTFLKREGAALPVTEFSGEVYDANGDRRPPGTLIEAYVGDVRCGVASVRRTGSFSGYILAVAGPASVQGCAEGGTIRFQIDGEPAAETATNDLEGSHLDLTLP